MEEIHQQPSIKISVLPVPRLVEINNLFGQCLEGGSFRKLLKSLCPCHQTIESVAQSGFSSTSKIIGVLLEHEVNAQGFIFQGIRWWPVINLVTLIHGYSHFIFLEIVVGYWKLRNFRETQANLIGLLAKPGIMYPSRNS